MGTPSSFTKDVGDRILAAFRSGVYASTAAQSCGVIPKTMLRWVMRGQQESAPPEMREFSDAFMIIDATHEKQVIKRIQSAGDPQEITTQRTETEADGTQKTVAEVRTIPGDVNALKWYAERRWPKRWAAPKEGQQPGLEEVQASKVLEEAEGREFSLDEIIEEMSPELEAALLRNADRVRALLEKAPSEPKK